MNKMLIVHQKKGHNMLYTHLCHVLLLNLYKASSFIISECETDDKYYFQDFFKSFLFAQLICVLTHYKANSVLLINLLGISNSPKSRISS